MTWKELRGVTICSFVVSFPACALAAEIIRDRDCGSGRAKTEVMELLPGSESTFTPAGWRQFYEQG